MPVLKKMASTPTSDIARRIEDLRTRRQEEVIQMAKDAGETPISDVLLSLITPEAYKEAGAMVGINSNNPNTTASTSGVVGLPATNLSQPSTSVNLKNAGKTKTTNNIRISEELSIRANPTGCVNHLSSASA
jgi:hypothetical protein